MAADRLPIIGFMHICMINEYLEIVGEQINLMVTSGLYDEVKRVDIGCVGPEENLELLKRAYKPFDKLHFQIHSKDIEKYEFLTLGMLQQRSIISAQFHGFYIHTKGVSWPGHEGGKHWRDYMNHYILTKWQDNIRMLEFGYDTCGVKLVNKRFPLHYSGNFFWFSSEYVKVLPKVLKSDMTDRFNAEMWIGCGQPICATLCQQFVDYDTQGKFIPKDSKCITQKIES